MSVEKRWPERVVSRPSLIKAAAPWEVAEALRGHDQPTFGEIIDWLDFLNERRQEITERIVVAEEFHYDDIDYLRKTLSEITELI